MIAADSSTEIAYFQGDSGRDVKLLDMALESADPELSLGGRTGTRCKVDAMPARASQGSGTACLDMPGLSALKSASEGPPPVAWCDWRHTVTLGGRASGYEPRQLGTSCW